MLLVCAMFSWMLPADCLMLGQAAKPPASDDLASQSDLFEASQATLSSRSNQSIIKAMIKTCSDTVGIQLGDSGEIRGMN